MEIIKNILNALDLRNNVDDSHNAIVHVPKHTVSISVYKKNQKYVKSCGKNEIKHKKNSLFDKYMSVLRPETPTGMKRIVEKKPIGKWSITIYRKKRIFVSTQIN